MSTGYAATRRDERDIRGWVAGEHQSHIHEQNDLHDGRDVTIVPDLAN